MNGGERTVNDGIHYFVINLDRSPDRLSRITQNLASLGVAFTRVRAIDGRRLTLPIPGIEPARYRRCHGKDLRLPEVGAYLSHLRAMRTFLATPHAYAMILEDDAVVTEDAVRLAEALTASGAPDDWDMVKFEIHHNSFGLPLRRLFGTYKLCAVATRPTGAAAYLVNRPGAAALLEGLLPMEVPIDHAFDRGWALHMRVRTIMPVPIRVNYDQSITYTSDNPARKVAVWEKGPTLMWRTGTEIMRFLSALHSWLAPTRAFPWPHRKPGGAALADGAERAASQTSPA